MTRSSSLVGKHTPVVIAVPTIKVKTEPFYKLMGSELRKMYEAKLLDAPAYVLLIVKTHGAAGWKWTFKVKDFCQEWGLNERTFYRAISKLKSMDLLQWETQDSITVWHGADIAKDDGDESDEMSINTLTPVSVPVSPVSVPVSPVSVPVTAMTQETAETVAELEPQKPSDSSQIYLNQQQINAVVVDKKGFAKEKEASQPTTEEVKAVLTKLRAMHVDFEINSTIRRIVKKYYDNVEDAIAHIKERIAQGEKFRSIEAAFVEACKEGRCPEKSNSPCEEINPPTNEQMTLLEEAKATGAILDHFLSTDGVVKVVMPNGIHVQPWWVFLDVQT